MRKASQRNRFDREIKKAFDSAFKAGHGKTYSCSQCDMSGLIVMTSEYFIKLLRQLSKK